MKETHTKTQHPSSPFTLVSFSWLALSRRCFRSYISLSYLCCRPVTMLSCWSRDRARLSLLSNSQSCALSDSIVDSAVCSFFTSWKEGNSPLHIYYILQGHTRIRFSIREVHYYQYHVNDATLKYESGIIILKLWEKKITSITWGNIYRIYCSKYISDLLFLLCISNTAHRLYTLLSNLWTHADLNGKPARQESEYSKLWMT